MRVRALCLSLLAASVLCLPVGASQHEGFAGKLIANPPITPPPNPNGLPGVGCTGFLWAEAFTPVLFNPSDTVTLDMAIIPFRSGSTQVDLSNVMHLRFADGLVNGLPYKRSAWNNVRAEVRPATNDFMLTLNGLQAGPFPNVFPCAPAGDCRALQALSIRGDLFDGSVAWIDSISVVHDSAAGQAVVFERAFDQCYSSQNVFLGGLLIVEPPQKLSSGGPR